MKYQPFPPTWERGWTKISFVLDAWSLANILAVKLDRTSYPKLIAPILLFLVKFFEFRREKRIIWYLENIKLESADKFHKLSVHILLDLDILRHLCCDDWIWLSRSNLSKYCRTLSILSRKAADAGEEHAKITKN